MRPNVAPSVSYRSVLNVGMLYVKIIHILMKSKRKKNTRNIFSNLRKMSTLSQYFYNIFYWQVSFDLSLARGLDYYTGVIYEAVLQGIIIASLLCSVYTRNIRKVKHKYIIKIKFMQVYDYSIK